MSTMIRKAVGAALLASVALPMSAAMAASLYGGGATFPAVPYVGADFKLVTPNARKSTDLGEGAPTPPWTASVINPTSIFGRFRTQNGHLLSYCQTGSGTGKSVLNFAVPSTSDCRDFSASQLSFFAPQVDFIGTDAPVNGTEYGTFNANRSGTATAVVQFPSLAGSIALPFQHSGFSGTLNLTVPQVCGIFRGTISNWSTVGLPALPIKIGYRTDNSGTSYAFSTFLAKNCNVANGGPIANRPDGTAWWQANQSYAASIPSPLPATYFGASGNNNLVAAVYNPLNDGGIAYADPGDVQAFAGANWARVGGFDPMAFSFTLPNSALLVGQVVSAVGNTMTGVSTVSPAPTPSSNFASLLVVDPSFSVSTGYPIFAVTYLGATKTGNGAANAPALRCLGHFIYNHTGVAGCTLGRPAALPVGYAYIDDSTSLPLRTKINLSINSIAP